MKSDEIFQELNNEYYKLYRSMPKIPISVIVTESIDKANCKLRPDLKNRIIIEVTENNYNYNGRMVLPYLVGDTISILLNSENMIKYTEDGSMTWVGTFAHELTHAIDYHLIALKDNLDIYDPLLELKDNRYLMFNLWSEYHARKFGYNFLNNIMCKNLNISEDEKIKHIKDNEWPFHINNYYKEYRATNKGIQQIYRTLQLIGSYSVGCDLYPTKFNEAQFKIICDSCPWVYKIFAFLRKHESIDEIYAEFSKMREIFKENWMDF
ncbi:MAG: hypothetical protein JJE03_00420 [Peptostreptococcaceae bacterium]|nr:hypothetical protein [Peptostreptococcaceae bacterium]